MANINTGELKPWGDVTQAEKESGQWVPVEDLLKPSEDLLEFAWGIIANAGGGNWTLETQDWQDAAARFRAEYFKMLNERKMRQMMGELTKARERGHFDATGKAL